MIHTGIGYLVGLALNIQSKNNVLCDKKSEDISLLCGSIKLCNLHYMTWQPSINCETLIELTRIKIKEHFCRWLAKYSFSHL